MQGNAYSCFWSYIRRNPVFYCQALNPPLIFDDKGGGKVPVSGAYFSLS